MTSGFLAYGPLIAATISLLSAIISYLNYRFVIHNRKAAYRDALYKKQIDAYEKIFSLIVPFHHSILDSLDRKAEDRLSLLNPALEIMKSGKYDELLFEMQKGQFYLSGSFTDAMGEYLHTVSMIQMPGKYLTEKEFRSAEEIQKIKDDRAEANRQREEDALPAITAEPQLFTTRRATVEEIRRAIEADIWNVYRNLVRTVRQEIGAEPLQAEIEAIIRRQ